eukprot:UN3419
MTIRYIDSLRAARVRCTQKHVRIAAVAPTGAARMLNVPVESKDYSLSAACALSAPAALGSTCYNCSSLWHRHDAACMLNAPIVPPTDCTLQRQSA